MESAAQKLKFFDIAANLADDQFSGHYYDKKLHQSDVDDVMQRAQDVGCDRLLIVGGYIQDSIKSYELSQKSQKYYCTVGVHPCRAQEVEKNGYNIQSYIQQLEELILKYKGKCVAIGECGLDYDRLQYSTKEEQLQVFPFHFDLAQQYKLPMYLHNRNTGSDFFDLVKANRSRFSGGIVHSFTGTEEELIHSLDLGLYIGVNGCSLKTKENIEVLQQIPLNQMMLETDSPYCEIRNTHVGAPLIQTQFPSIQQEKWKKDHLIKGRNEPCQIKQVSEVVASILQIPEQELCKITYENTLQFFNLEQQE